MQRGLFLCAFALALPALAFGAAPAPGHVRADLVAETTALVPGQRNWVGVRLRHDPHWHTYWINPGDSGLPTKLVWHVPSTVKAGDIAWPAPQRFEVGGLFNFGYAGDIVLPVPLDVAADAPAGTRIELAVDAQWLVCREECVPGKATLKRSLPVATATTPATGTHKLFAAAHAAQPLASTWSGSARLDADQVEIALRGDSLPETDGLDAFVVQRQVVGYAPAQVARRDDQLTLTFARSEYLTAVPVALDLVLVEGRGAQAVARSVTVPFVARETRPGD